MRNSHGQPTFPRVFMPGDGRPAPWLMTEDELISFLRIDETSARFKGNSIARLRKKYPHILRPVLLGKAVRYKLRDAIDMIDQMQEDDPR